MKKIFEIFGLNKPKDDDAFGVELELEYNNHAAASGE